MELLPTHIWTEIAQKVKTNLEPLSRVSKELRSVAKREQKHRHDRVLKTYKEMRRFIDKFEELADEIMDDLMDELVEGWTFGDVLCDPDNKWYERVVELQGELVRVVEDSPDDMVGLTDLAFSEFAGDFGFFKPAAIALIRKFPHDSCIVYTYICIDHGKFLGCDWYYALMECGDAVAEQLIEDLVFQFTEEAYYLDTYDDGPNAWTLMSLVMTATEKMKDIQILYDEFMGKVEVVGSAYRHTQKRYPGGTSMYIRMLRGLWNMCERGKRPDFRKVVWECLKVRVMGRGVSVVAKRKARRSK